MISKNEISKNYEIGNVKIGENPITSNKSHYRKLKVEPYINAKGEERTSVGIKIEEKYEHLIQAPAVEERLTRIAYKAFKEKWNAEQIQEYGSKKSAGKYLLRGVHNKLVSTLIHFYQSQLEADTIKFKNKPIFRCVDSTQELPSYESNNPHLASIDQVDVKTIYNHLDRLIKAKVLRKIFHGSNRNYELVFNSEIMILIDRLNMDYIPNSEYLSENNLKFSPFLNLNSAKKVEIKNTENQLIENPKRETLPPLYFSSKTEEPFNSINDVDNSESVDKQKLEVLRNNAYAEKEHSKTVKSPQQQPTFSKDIQEQKREKVAEKREKDTDFEELKRLAGETFFAQAFKILYFDKDVKEYEYDRVKKYVGLHYFAHCKSKAQINRDFDEFIWRVTRVRAWKDRIVTRYIQWPSLYFDISNKIGFADSKKWRQDQVKKEAERKKASEKRAKDNDKLMIQFEKLIKTRDRTTYNQCRTYVENNIPHLLLNFEQMVMSLDSNN